MSRDQSNIRYREIYPYSWVPYCGVVLYFVHIYDKEASPISDEATFDPENEMLFRTSIHFEVRKFPAAARIKDKPTATPAVVVISMNSPRNSSWFTE